jgi:hypothetical protein
MEVLGLLSRDGCGDPLVAPVLIVERASKLLPGSGAA